MTSDVVDVIRDYEAWKIRNKFEDDDAKNYARYLETARELRILKVARYYFGESVNNDVFNFPTMDAILIGEEDVLRKVEEEYED